MAALPTTVQAAYRAAGWAITPGGRPDLGHTTGPCGGCRRPTARYGAVGGTWCLHCRNRGLS